jgi:hypothetical protein
VHGFPARRRCNNLVSPRYPQTDADSTAVTAVLQVLMQSFTTALLEMPSRRYKPNGAIETLVPERHGLRRSNSSGALPAWWSRVMNAILYPLAYITSIAKY